jgi:hypothetical protein
MPQEWEELLCNLTLSKELPGPVLPCSHNSVGALCGR